jgi:hypothetical protein
MVTTILAAIGCYTVARLVTRVVFAVIMYRQGWRSVDGKLVNIYHKEREQ